MIKIIKYTAFMLTSIIFVMFCGEIAYFELTDKAYSEFNCIIFSKAYDCSKLREDLEDLSEKYNCFGFYTAYDYSDSTIEINYCTNNSADKITEKMGIKNCNINTVTTGSYHIEFVPAEKYDTDNTGDIGIQAFYVDSDKSENINAFCEELGNKYLIEVNSKEPVKSSSVPVGIVCLVLIMLLTVYDVMRSKRDICISLTLGNKLLLEIIKWVLKDMAVYAVFGTFIIAILYKITAVSLIYDKYIIYVCTAGLIDLGAYLSLFAMDLCSTLKRENSSAAFIPLNFFLKLLSSCVLLILLSYTGKMMSLRSKYTAAEEFCKYFDGFNRIEMTESPQWAMMIDSYVNNSGSDVNAISGLIDKELAEYNVFIDTVDEESKFMLLNAFDFQTADMNDKRAPNVLIASDYAGKYIIDKTGIELDSEKLSVLVPKKYVMSDLSLIKKFLGSYGYNIPENEINYIDYTSADIAVFNYIGEEIISDYKFDIMHSPIIIYAPHAAEYDYFDQHSILTDSTREKADLILKRKMLMSVFFDISSVISRTDGFKKKIKSETVIFVLTILAVMFYYIAVLFSTIIIDLKLNEKDRAISMIQGNSFFIRYGKTLFIFLMSFSLLTIILAVIQNIIKLSFSITIPGIIGVILFELIAFVLLSKNSERKNLIKILKGGAL